MKKNNRILFTIVAFVFSLISVSAMEGVSGNTISANDEGNIAVNNTVENAKMPLLANVYARDIKTLNGQWHYLIDQQEMGYYDYRMRIWKDGFFKNQHFTQRGLVEYDFDLAPTMQIPSDWNTRDPHLYLYEGTVWFKKSFNIKKESDKRYVIYFGAANYKSIVYVNGEKIGEHVGGYTPFNFDITSVIKDGENFVIVKVDNSRAKENIPTEICDWWNYGGITRDVSLAILPQKYVADYKLTYSNDWKNDPRAKKGVISGYVQLNNKTAGEQVKLSIPELKLSLDLKTDANGRADFSFNARPELWSPQSPKLYDVNFSYDDCNLSDEIGFRTIETEGKKILLNGKHIFLRGVSIHEEAPFGLGRANSADQARVLLSWAKDMGCNYVRLAHYPHNEHAVREAERMGIMVWSEIPVYWTIDWTNPETLANAKNQLDEEITRDKNRANIVIWSVANETPHGDARDKFLTSLVKYAREKDSTRLISMAMEVTSADGLTNTLNDNMHKYVDVLSFNEYVGWYRASNELATKFVWNIPYDKPVIISEFGAAALQGLHGDKRDRWTEEYQAETYRANLEMLDKIDGLSGMSPWILVDFRSPRRHLTGIQNDYNRKGLISPEGIKKQAFSVMQNYYEKKAKMFK